MSKEIITGIRAKRVENIIFLSVLFAFQVLMIILYAVWVRYDSNADHDTTPLVINGTVVNVPNPVQDTINSTYGYFRDVNIMIFFGFGFLMTFLRRYGYSALGYTFLISAMVAQWSILVWGFYETVHHSSTHFASTFHFNIVTMLNGLFCAGSVMISYGAILGKVTPLQMLVMGIIEPIFYFLNMFIGELKLQAVDVGGGMYIHLFGAYYGLTVCWFLTNKQSKESPDNAPSYNGDLFSMAGTIFLWIMWPSFNAAIAPPGDAQFRALANTFLSLTASTIATFLVTRLVGHWGYKFDMVHVQNSTLAGGVVQGVLAHLNISPAVAIAMGFIVGCISVLGYIFLTPFLTKKFNIQDVCGVNNLHGMPGFIGSIAAVIACARGVNNQYLYGSDYDVIFRAGADQAKNNAAQTFITLGIAIVGGLITGVILKFVGKFGQLQKEEYFNDNAFWNVASDYPGELDQYATDVESQRAQHQATNNIEMETKKSTTGEIDLNDFKKKGSSRAYRKEIIRLLETLVLSENLARKFDSDSETSSDSESSESDDEDRAPRKHHGRKRKSSRRSKRDQSNGSEKKDQSSNNNNNNDNNNNSSNQ
eukprot:gene9781-11422_t